MFNLGLRLQTDVSSLFWLYPEMILISQLNYGKKLEPIRTVTEECQGVHVWTPVLLGVSLIIQKDNV